MKPESRFIGNVHKQLHPDVYHEKMFNPMRGGTPDCYYMGYLKTLWVEYKWVKKLPKIIRPKLSPLQFAWLMRAWDRGQRPLVIVGSPTGSVVLVDPAQWLNGTARDKARVITIAEIATEIQNRCGLENLPALPSAQRPSTTSPSSRP